MLFEPVAMTIGGLATLVGLDWLPAGQLLGWLTWLLLTCTIEAIRLTARLSGRPVLNLSAVLLLAGGVLGVPCLTRMGSRLCQLTRIAALYQAHHSQYVH